MTTWLGVPSTDPTVDPPKSREAIVTDLNKVLPTGFVATEELGVMVTARRLRRDGTEGWGPRVARTYTRKVYWFKSGDQAQSYHSTGSLVLVGDAGTGRGWKERQVALFQEAVRLFQEWYTSNGWDPHS